MLYEISQRRDLHIITICKSNLTWIFISLISRITAVLVVDFYCKRPRTVFRLHCTQSYHSTEHVTLDGKIVETRFKNRWQPQVLQWKGILIKTKQNKLKSGHTHRYFENPRLLYLTFPCVVLFYHRTCANHTLCTDVQWQHAVKKRDVFSVKTDKNVNTLFLSWIYYRMLTLWI